MNKLPRFLLYGLGLIGLVICQIAVLYYFLAANPLDLAFSSDDQGPLLSYVQVPPLAEVGEEFQMVVTVSNEGEDYLQIDEIRLPQELLDVVVVTNIFPGSLEQATYEDKVGFQIGFLLAPGDRQSFEFTLLSKETADVVGEMQIVAGEIVVENGLRLVFAKGVAVIPTATPTLMPTPTATLTPTPIPTLTPTPEPVVPFQAVVRIVAKVKRYSRFDDVWIGSGTIITPDGLILTNAHLVTPNKFIEVDAYAIELTLRPDESPVEVYYAEPIQIDTDLDIAVFQITEDMDFRPVDRSQLNLPTVPLGDSDELLLGDLLTIVGYPIIGGDSITVSRGDVGGFTASRKYGERAFIKTAASISGGTSGGLAMNQYGALVGIPTQLGPGYGDEFVDCRVVADTNGDGDVNTRDGCVPVGGFINVMRPVNLAWPLVEAAMQQAGSEFGPGQPLPTPTPTPAN